MQPIRHPFAIILLLVALDQAIKVWIRLQIELYHSRTLVAYLLELTHVENRGVSFSFLGGLSDQWRLPLLLAVTCLAIGAMGGFWWRHRGGMHRVEEWGFLLILGGAVGNLIDRGYYGTVTDYLHFHWGETSFFVNNLADIFISGGVALFVAAHFFSPRSGQA